MSQMRGEESQAPFLGFRHEVGLQIHVVIEKIRMFRLSFRILLKLSLAAHPPFDRRIYLPLGDNPKFLITTFWPDIRLRFRR